MQLKARRKITILPRTKVLRQAKIDRGLTVGQIAEHLGLNRTTLEHQFSGGTLWTLERAQQIAEFFNRDFDDLFISIDLENPEHFFKARAA